MKFIFILALISCFYGVSFGDDGETPSNDLGLSKMSLDTLHKLFNVGFELLEKVLKDSIDETMVNDVKEAFEDLIRAFKELSEPGSSGNPFDARNEINKFNDVLTTYLNALENKFKDSLNGLQEFLSSNDSLPDKVVKFWKILLDSFPNIKTIGEDLVKPLAKAIEGLIIILLELITSGLKGLESITVKLAVSTFTTVIQPLVNLIESSTVPDFLKKLVNALKVLLGKIGFILKNNSQVDILTRLTDDLGQLSGNSSTDLLIQSLKRILQSVTEAISALGA